ALTRTHRVALPNGSRLSCGALKKDSSFLRIYARRQRQALVRRPRGHHRKSLPHPSVNSTRLRRSAARRAQPGARGWLTRGADGPTQPECSRARRVRRGPPAARRAAWLARAPRRAGSDRQWPADQATDEEWVGVAPQWWP